VTAAKQAPASAGRPEVIIVGGGPAGLAAAARLAPRVTGTVLVLEREEHAGGIPRHSDHSGYGLRDLHRLMRGPQYARRLDGLARDAGAVVCTSAMVTGWDPGGGVAVTSPDGRQVLTAPVILLATGARERPRSARLVPGDRPAGVYTTGQLQNLVHLHHQVPGSRAVVAGSELVSWSAVLALRHAGCATVLMASVHDRPESYAAVTLAGRTALGFPVAARTKVTRVIGRGRVEAVEIMHLGTGRRRVVPCDTVVFTGDWIPDNELARAAGLGIDAGSGGPVVDTALRTSADGIFAAGNLVHPVDTADVAALSGRHAARQIERWLAGDRPDRRGVRLAAAPPLRWVSPGLVRPGDPAPARQRLLAWADELVRAPRVTLIQDGHRIASMRLPWAAAPGRIFRMPSSLLDHIDPGGGEATVSLRG